MSEPTTEELKAQIAELEAELQRRPAVAVTASPRTPWAGPRIPPAAPPVTCNVCAQVWGSFRPGERDTEPCSNCGAKTVARPPVFGRPEIGRAAPARIVLDPDRLVPAGSQLCGRCQDRHLPGQHTRPLGGK